MKFVVCVTFVIDQDKVLQFGELLHENAEASLKNEPGCIQFDVCTDPAYPNEVFLYEVYASRDAFDVHLKSDHFTRFDAAVASMIKDKHVKAYRMVN